VTTYHALVFVQHLIILTERDEEDESGDILETVDPLLSLASLATHVEELVRKLADLEGRFCDPCRFDTTTKDILIGGHVMRFGHAVDSGEVVHGGIVELELSGAADGLTHARIPPETLDGIGDISRENVGLNLRWQGKDDRTAGVILWGKRDVQLGHGLEDGTHRLDGI
jgi:hypothetical protein